MHSLRRMKVRLALVLLAQQTPVFTSFRKTHNQYTTLEKFGGEGRNRTYPPARSVGAAVLKTATTTRHASLSGAASANSTGNLRGIGYSIRLAAEDFFKTGAQSPARPFPFQIVCTRRRTSFKNSSRALNLGLWKTVKNS